MNPKFALIFETKADLDEAIIKLTKPKNQAKLTNTKTCKTCGKEIDERYDYCYPCYQKKDKEE